VPIDVWRLAGDTLNITCNFLYCNLQVDRDFLITMYIYTYVCVCVFVGEEGGGLACVLT